MAAADAADLVCKEYAALGRDDDLWRAWEALLPRLPERERFMTPEWFAAWGDTIGAAGSWNASVRILAVWAGASLEGVMVLRGIGKRFLRLYSLAGEWQPWRAVLVAAGKEAPVARCLAAHLAGARFNLIRLGPCLGSSPALNALVGQLGDKGLTALLRHRSHLAQFQWDRDWESYETEVLGKELKGIASKQRRLRKEGELDIKRFSSPVAGNARAVMDDVGAIEERSWLSEETGSPRFATDAQRTFWTRAIEQSLPDGCCFDVWVMYCDSAPISFVLALSAGKTRFFLANNYDERFKKYSTGSILYHYVIQDALSRGIRCFDFGTGGLSYKGRWGAQYIDDTSIYAAFPRGGRGWILRLLVRLAEKLGIKLPI